MAINFAGKYKGGRPIYDVVTGSKAAYDNFMKLNPKLKLTCKEYRECIIQLNLYYVRRMLETGHKVILPYGLGKIMVHKKPVLDVTPDNKHFPKIQGINWKETMKEGKVIVWSNAATNGHRFRWAWLKANAKVKHKGIWKFKMYKENARLLSKHITDTDNNYVELYRELPHFYRKVNKLEGHDKWK